MEKEGKLLDCLVAAFEGHEDELTGRLKAALPDEWIKAPDQTVMLQYNWVIEDEEGDDYGLKIDFKDDKICLGRYDKSVTVKREKIPTNGRFCIERGGCAECMGGEHYDFELWMNLKMGASQT
jgi:hypothetical protein